MALDPVLTSFRSDPWERQRSDDNKLEPTLWYTRFRTYYLPQGPGRSLVEANNLWRDEKGQKRSSHATGAWRRNAEWWRWVERAEAYDLEEQRKLIAEEEEERREMRRRHLQYARAMQGVSAYEIGRLRKLIEEQKSTELTDAEVRRWMIEGISIERQARGIPDHLLAVATMDDDELLKHIQALLSTRSDIGLGRVSDRSEAEEPQPPWGFADDD